MARCLPRAVAVAATVLSLGTGCGGADRTVAGTRLLIRVHDRHLARIYRLSCLPDRGTVPNPVRACRALRRERDLLVGGIGFDHSCPAGPWAEVVGQRDGRPVAITFTACRSVPGQATPDAWFELVGYRFRGSNQYGAPSSNDPLRSAADLRREAQVRTHFQQEALAVGRRAQRLARLRRAELRSGRLSIAAATRPDPLTRRILRLDALAAATAGGYPHPTEATLYVGRRGSGRFFIAVFVGPAQLSLGYEAKSLRPTSWGIGPRQVRHLAHGTLLLG